MDITLVMLPLAWLLAVLRERDVAVVPPPSLLWCHCRNFDIVAASAALLEEAPPSSVILGSVVVLRKDRISLKRGAPGLNGPHAGDAFVGVVGAGSERETSLLWSLRDCWNKT